MSIPNFSPAPAPRHVLVPRRFRQRLIQRLQRPGRGQSTTGTTGSSAAAATLHGAGYKVQGLGKVEVLYEDFRGFYEIL
jgi:hypothetical protein